MRLILFILFSLQWSLISAQITLTDFNSDFSVTGENAQIYEDSSGNLSFQEVQIKKFESQENLLLKNNNPNSTYWVKFSIKNLSDDETRWILEAITPNLYMLEVWIPDSKGNMQLHKAGLSNIKMKEYAHKNYVFDLPSVIKEYDVYARVKSPNITGIEFKIHSQQFFVWYALHEYYYLGIYYGILLIMLVYNLLVYVTNRERVYLFYVLYLASCMFLSLSEDGLGLALLWQDYAVHNINFTHYLSPSLFLISFVLYARSFLNLSKNFPVADKIAVAGALFFPGVNFLQLISGKDIYFHLEDYYLVPFGIIFIASVYVYVKGYKSARFFILGYVVVFLCMIILQLRLYRIIDSTIFTVYIFNFGILIETVILSFALADRLRNIRKEKEKSDHKLFSQLQENSRLQEQLVHELQEKNDLTEKVNRELEQKVQQRTSDLMLKTEELIKANEKLDAYSKMLTDMNLKLDLDNWQLKKEVKKERTARIVQQEITYEEFIKSFADKNACLRYLENLKWGESYACKKCGNEKFTPKMFSRKCTRCDYIESATSHTLFHGIKIPLHKAFFMIYATNSKGKKITLEEMSNLLEIGKNTCWDFRKKIKVRQEEKKKSLKVKEVESWDLLILD